MDDPMTESMMSQKKNGSQRCFQTNPFLEDEKVLWYAIVRGC
jgi:hypothetical protein